MSAFRPCSQDCAHHAPDTDRANHPLDVLGKHAQRHHAAHVAEPPRQEMDVPHSCLDRAERVLDRAAAQSHAIGVTAKPLSRGIDQRRSCAPANHLSEAHHTLILWRTYKLLLEKSGFGRDPPLSRCRAGRSLHPAMNDWSPRLLRLSCRTRVRPLSALYVGRVWLKGLLFSNHE